mmetsp:Transcript_21531/g.32039  ORF Transcript_21531/g.32039 Transcript_21531/m.32039 type:complete len:208 (+) Transcript_21531:1-624(+)
MYSARGEAAHDAQCGFKLLPCELGCSEHLIRSAMAVHTAGPCPNRPVDCPFKAVGCGAHVTQGELAHHLVEATPAHLMIMLEVFSQQQKQLNACGAHMTAQETLIIQQRAALEAAYSDFTAMEQKLQAAEEANKALRKDLDGALKTLSSVSKQQEAQGKRSAALAEDLAKLGTQQKTLKQHVHSELSKTTAECADLSIRVRQLESAP